MNKTQSRRELSTSQAAAFLSGKPSHYTDAKFVRCCWSRTLSWIAPSVFLVFSKNTTQTQSDATANEEATGDSMRPDTPQVPPKKAIRTQHSHSGSISHYSDASSDGHHPSSSISPPPVPRVPNGFADLILSETPDFEEDKVVIDPKTPSDFALHAVFMRFASTAEVKIDIFLRQPLETDPLLPHFIGPDTDPKFDEILRSLGMSNLKFLLEIKRLLKRIQLTSLGEYAALVIAEVLSLEDALMIVANRVRLTVQQG
ncbi:hypothetical protein K435DRAFT_851695 [Dendrothele bispora CBS 962.96]|uniref:Uncharacterized protein n=1 Tax=Dendrothele bispora (strain CBS 962.96) TaxID=1314807 RepID=A0A4S8ML26_DENBC|nr:hypothetical protein K435DRAFT_851695 [Dendrothele bispora CBS 962.96]